MLNTEILKQDTTLFILINFTIFNLFAFFITILFLLLILFLILVSINMLDFNKQHTKSFYLLRPKQDYLDSLIFTCIFIIHFFAFFVLMLTFLILFSLFFLKIYSISIFLSIVII